MRRAVIAIAAGSLCASLQAHASDCYSANTNLKAARARIARDSDTYAACLGQATGDAVCGKEFRRLKDAQAKLEEAAGDLVSNCPQD